MTTATLRAQRATDPRNALLLEQLLSLKYRALEEVVRQLLASMGYQNVTTLSGQSPIRARKTGGRDVQAVHETGLTRGLVLAQIKQYRRPVQRRFVDELLGVMTHTNARHGLLITTGTFSRAAKYVAGIERPPAIRLVDGDELVRLLMTHGIGITRNGKGTRQIDRSYFDDLNERFPKHGRRGPGLWPQTRHLSSNPLDSTRHQSVTEEPEGGEVVAQTHVLFSISTLWIMQCIPGAVTNDNIALLVAAATLGALLPDLDAAHSKLSHLSIGNVRPFMPIAGVIHRSLGHRGILHSPLALMTLAVGLVFTAPWWTWQVSLALWLGYASLLVADACTRRGIPGQPFHLRMFLLPPRLRFVTGSQAESMLLPILASTALYFLLLNLFHPR